MTMSVKSTKPWLRVAMSKKNSFNTGRPGEAEHNGRRVSAHEVSLVSDHPVALSVSLPLSPPKKEQKKSVFSFH